MLQQQHHKKLNQEERFYISKRIQAGDNKRQIATDLKRSPSTILREIARNQDSTTTIYSGLVATEKAQLRQKNANRKVAVITIISSKAYYTILEELQKRSSPEQISAILSNELGEPISYQAIYNYIMHDKANGGKLYLFLRRKGRGYRYAKKSAKVVINGKKSIELRPLKLLLLQSFGHWEIDTIFGKDQKSYLLTLVEMRTKYTIIRKIANKEASTVKAEMDKIIAETGIIIKTMTSDNGGEFAAHAEISKLYNFDWFFCHPFCSGERGLNENTNGLIRDFLPKGTDFNLISDEEILEIQNILNNRPRKALQFKRPVYVFVEHWAEASNQQEQPINVA
jgi:transposase, IS30 family|tara:strand:- start:254 stop:1270 length:1017 start_codon:yes stop_codon:yes gene_type:complete